MAKILVVDDDPDFVYLIRIHLERADHSVVVARNGTEGLKAILAEKPDLIILDVMMDTLTEGFQFALKIRSPAPASPFKEMRDIPVIMLTSIHSTTALRFSPEKDYLPVDEFIEKPFDPDDLIKRIDRYVRQ